MRLPTIAALMLGAAFSVNASNVDYWGENPIRVKQSTHSTSGFNPALHNQFANSPDYEEGGRFYYSNYLNSFGQKERLNTEQEIIFCQGNEKTFSEMIEAELYKQSGIRSTDNLSSRQMGLTAVLSAAYSGLDGFGLPSSGDDVLFSVNADATSVGFTPEALVGAIEKTLRESNSTSNSLGRFCYRENDSRVDYRTPSAASAVYCDPSRVAAHAQAKTFTDTSSMNSCSLKLDAPIKVGETRFLRQLQADSEVTIAQGFLGCYKNSDTGIPEVVLISNPPSCTKTNRGDCAHTCEWAYEVVCDAQTMPKWGGGQCAAYGTMIFKDDVIEVNSIDGLSYNRDLNKQFRGEAIMTCAMVSGKAQWIVNNSTCSEVSSQ